jgi:hypothetical protein
MGSDILSIIVDERILSHKQLIFLYILWQSSWYLGHTTHNILDHDDRFGPSDIDDSSVIDIRVRKLWNKMSCADFLMVSCHDNNGMTHRMEPLLQSAQIDCSHQIP